MQGSRIEVQSQTSRMRPPLPPFTRESAIQKVRLAEDGWILPVRGGILKRWLWLTTIDFALGEIAPTFCGYWTGEEIYRAF
jgi:hypothetical protein